MPTIAISVPDEVGEALSRQARALLLGRRQYIRSLLAAVAKADPEACAVAAYASARGPQADAPSKAPLP